MVDVFSDLMAWLNDTAFLGMPNWILVGGIIFVFYVIYSMKPKEQQFKRMDTAKEIKQDLDFLFKTFSTPLDKRLDSGITKVRHAFSYIPIYWDDNFSLKENLQDERQLRRFLKQNPKLNEKGKLKQDFDDMYVLKVCGHTLPNRLLGKIGVGVSYMIIPKGMLDMSKDVLVLDTKSVPSTMFGVTIFSKSGREFIENVVYKLNRQNELDEFVNQIPKQNYLEVSTASAVAKARERANIEREKYKGQLESAEGS